MEKCDISALVHFLEFDEITTSIVDSVLFLHFDFVYYF
jgi:hypothetical protein